MNNLELMRKRLEYQGGIYQEDRMIQGKLWTMHHALLYSYQACTIQKVQSYNEVLPADWINTDIDTSPYPYDRALINPDKIKQDYDDKILSIDHELNYNPGDVFEWKKTDSYWIIYLQELSEDAYFRGEIRRCRHRIKFIDNNGNWCSTWAAIRGPVETQINSIQKNQIRVDTPNLSLNILMPRNDITLQAFDRYKEFLYAGKCWRVEAPDSISMKNIIEVNAEEYYVDPSTDDESKEMKNGLVIQPIDPTPISDIKGETWIKPKIAEIYSIDDQAGRWCIKEEVPVSIKQIDNKSISLVWNKAVSGQFTLQWKKNGIVKEKTIVVESLY